MKEIEENKAKELIKKYGSLSIDVVREIINNRPHKRVERFYADSGGNMTKDSYFETCPNELFWQEVLNIIEKKYGQN